MAATATRSVREPDDVYNFAPTNHIQRPDEKWNAGAFANYEINRHFDVYMEVMYMNNYTDAQIAPSGNFFVYNQINCDNPMLSQQQWEIVCGPGTGYGPTDHAEVYIGRRNVEGAPRTNQLGHTNIRMMGGLRGEIDDEWSYDFYWLRAQNNSQDSYVNDLSVERIGNALDVIEDPDTGEWVCRSGFGVTAACHGTSSRGRGHPGGHRLHLDRGRSIRNDDDRSRQSDLCR